MSADNGIYILSLKDQHRVVHTQAIENLNWNYYTNKFEENPVSTRVFEIFEIANGYSSIHDALQYALALSKHYGYIEYGISTIPIDKTWEEILLEAKELYPKEIESLEKLSKKKRSYKYDLDMMKGDYLTLCENLQEMKPKGS